jgi:hypothetical protein
MAPWRTLSHSQPTFVVMLPLHFALASTWRFVSTIGSGAGKTNGPGRTKPPSAIWLLATGTA